jgi:hypothetical protein
MNRKQVVLRKLATGASAVVMTVGLIGSFDFPANASGSGTGNTGPANVVECGGFSNTYAKICLNENTNACLPTQCQ